MKIRKNRHPLCTVGVFAVIFLMLSGWVLPSLAEDLSPDFSDQLLSSIVVIDIDLSSLETGMVGAKNGKLSDNANYRRIRFFVIPGSTLDYCAGGNADKAGLAFYDRNGFFISGVSATKTLTKVEVPEGADYAYACFRAGKEDKFELKVRTRLDDWLKESRNLDQRRIAPFFVLPLKSAAVVGHEWNLYFDNVISGLSDQYSVVTDISPARLKKNAIQFEECLRILPEEEGEYQIRLRLISRVNGETVDEGSFTLYVLSDQKLPKAKVLFLGDSLTSSGIFPAEIQYNLSHGRIVSLGTLSTTAEIGEETLTVQHEGRAGWSASNYINDEEFAGKTNAFWNPDTKRFDFEWYMKQTGMEIPDMVFLGLGTNGMSEENRKNAVRDLELMIESIHAFRPELPIYVSLIAPPASQDGTGSQVGLQNAAQTKLGQLAMIRLYLERFENREDHVDVFPLYFNLDRLNDFENRKEALSARNPKQVVRQNNNVHPNQYGYLKFADVYYSTIVYELTKQASEDQKNHD